MSCPLPFVMNFSSGMRDLKSTGSSKILMVFNLILNGNVSFLSLAGGLKILDLSTDTSEITSQAAIVLGEMISSSFFCRRNVNQTFVAWFYLSNRVTMLLLNALYVFLLDYIPVLSCYAEPICHKTTLLTLYSEVKISFCED